MKTEKSHQPPPGMKNTNTCGITKLFVSILYYFNTRSFQIHFKMFELLIFIGIIRHQGLIPWDDDLDICILEENEDFFVEIIAPVLKDRYSICTVSANTFGYRMYHMYDSEVLDHQQSDLLLNYRYPFCDIFVMKIHKKIFLNTIQ